MAHRGSVRLTLLGVAERRLRLLGKSGQVENGGTRPSSGWRELPTLLIDRHPDGHQQLPAQPLGPQELALCSRMTGKAIFRDKKTGRGGVAAMICLGEGS